MKVNIDSNLINHKILKSVSLVESFYNISTHEARRLYKSNWFELNQLSDKAFYLRMKRPRLIDYALILYTFDSKIDSYIVEHFIHEFKNLPQVTFENND